MGEAQSGRTGGGIVGFSGVIMESIIGAFAVLNPGGRDKAREFPAGAGLPEDPGHPPVNYHAYAACCQGGYYRSVEEVPEEAGAVLVLLRQKGLSRALAAISQLRRPDRKIWISWKESGLHQVSEALGDARRLGTFQEICREADGFLSSTPELESLYRQAGCREGMFIPTPYPIEELEWDFSVPAVQRVGIFIGTREFDVPSRNHLLAVATACTLNVPVTVLNPDGSAEERLLRAISPEIQIVQGPLPYPEYLRLMATHRVVFQLDRSAVPGQVAGDALLCRLPCVGGDGAIERSAFPESCGFGRDVGSLTEIARRLLRDDNAYHHVVMNAEAAAAKALAFSVIAEQLARLGRECGNGPGGARTARISKGK